MLGVVMQVTFQISRDLHMTNRGGKWPPIQILGVTLLFCLINQRKHHF